jgi:hypothetical protein
MNKFRQDSPALHRRAGPPEAGKPQAGLQDRLDNELLEEWKDEILEYWNTGMLEFWDTGILGLWNSGIKRRVHGTGRKVHGK